MEKMIKAPELIQSRYVLVVVTVPTTHADLVRKAMGEAGIGESDKYAFASFSSRGIGRFRPKAEANPFIGRTGILETVDEERIESICRIDRLEKAVQATKAAHPYEETVIEIYPIFELGLKGFI